MKTRKIILVTILILVVAVGAFGGWYFGIKQPYDKAYADYEKRVASYDEAVQSLNESIREYNAKASKINEVNELLDNAINDAQLLIDQGDNPYDRNTLTYLSGMIAEGVSERITTKTMAESNPLGGPEKDDSSTKQLIERSKTLEEIEDSLWLERSRVIEQIGELRDPNYDSVINNIQQGQADLEHSIAVNRQITNPPEALIIKKLQSLPNVSGIAPATEDNDPNGNLNKAGGYTAAVFFNSPLVPRTELFSNDILENGTDGGGCIEVYVNENDAHKRNDYLSAFDGPGLFNPGSHTVLGTIVIRTSSHLKASQQKQMEQDFIDAMLIVD